MKSIHMRLFALALFGLLANATQAAIFTVGSGVTCTHGSIQGAINAAKSSGTDSIIRLTRSLTYEPEANTIDTTKEITVEGGYATCDQANPDTTRTIVSGFGGAHAPVFTIKAPTDVTVRIRQLTISGGDVDDTGAGGGIYFKGDGILEIVESTIELNKAGAGAGIYIEGTGSHTELIIGTNTVISRNTAAYNGGGVMAKGVEMTMVDPNTSILRNNALGKGGNGGYGGGLFIYADDRPSYGYIGSGGLFGAFYGNSAMYGGGVAILSAGSHTAELQLYATNAGLKTQIQSNSATKQGGGIYASSSRSTARLWNTGLDSNFAPNGGAIYMANKSTLYINLGVLPAAAVPCTVGSDCGRITNNTADAGSNPGSIVYGESDSTIMLGYQPLFPPDDARGGVFVQYNTSGSVFGGAASTIINRSVISDNTTSAAVIQQSDQPLTIADSTIAGNTIAVGNAILSATNSAIDLQRSILWQPGRTSLSRSGGTLSVYRVDAWDNTSLGGSFFASAFDPLFIDPAHGDYGLRAGSAAIDYARAFPGNERDALGRTRDIDLPNPNGQGPRDIGALERPALQPLVLNADFDYSDLRLWTKFDGAWDGTQNIVGGNNSGSWKYSIGSTNAVDVVVAEQCIVLPAPGSYLLTGWGKGGGTVLSSSYAIVKWEIRNNTLPTCQGGVVQSGQLPLGSGTSWGHPALPASIDLPQAQYGSDLSIKLMLVAHSGAATNPHSLSAWFDGITLDYIDDTIFKDGFE